MPAHPLAVGVVGRGLGSTGLGDLRREVLGVPALRPSAATGQLAVGVVGVALAAANGIKRIGPFSASQIGLLGW